MQLSIVIDISISNILFRTEMNTTTPQRKHRYDKRLHQSHKQVIHLQQHTFNFILMFILIVAITYRSQANTNVHTQYNPKQIQRNIHTLLFLLHNY